MQTKNNFSVIIPTMFRCTDILNRLLDNLNSDPAVDEIILINNTSNLNVDKTYVTHSKVRIVGKGENIFVNPSWNYGLQNAKNDLICLCNDDILIPERIFTGLQKINNYESYGILGAYEPLVQEIDAIEPYYINEFDVIPVNQRWNAFGVFMVFHKQNYTSVPETMKIWCGDDMNFHLNRLKGKQNYFLMFPIKTKMSSTSSDPIFEQIKQNDLIEYEKVKKDYNIYIP